MQGRMIKLNTRKHDQYLFTKQGKNTRETNSYTESELDSNNRAHYADNLRDW